MTRLTDAELLAYLDGTASPELASQVENSPEYRQRAQELNLLQHGLQTRLFRSGCPTALVIGEYHLGLLHPDQSSQVGQHLTICPHCKAELAQLRAFFTHRPGLLERARTLVAARLNPPSPGLQPVRLGVRGGDEPFMYSAGGVHVVFNVQADRRRPERKTLAGLVLGQPALGWEVHLVKGEEIVGETTIDELDNFIFGDLGAGDYEVRLYSAEEAILISPLLLD